MKHNYNELVGETRYTDAGEYTIVAHVYDDNCNDHSVNLYVGRHTTGGHCDLIASDNASMWVVGDADDAERNHYKWAVVGDRYDAARDAIRAIDADLVDWLDERKAEAAKTADNDTIN